MENNQINNSKPELKRDDLVQTKILKWGCSWAVLALAILFTGTAIFSLIDFVRSFKSGIVSIIVAGIPLLLNILCSVGVWQIFTFSLRKQVNPSGAKLVRGVWQFYKILISIVLILLDLVIILIVSIGVDFITKLDSSLGGVNGDLGDMFGAFTSSSMGILIGILLIFIVVTVLFMVFMSKVTKFANSVCDAMLYCKLHKVSTLGAAIFLFLIGGVMIISAFTPPYTVLGIFRALLASGSFILLGILALQFGGLYGKVELDYRVLNQNNLK